MKRFTQGLKLCILFPLFFSEDRDLLPSFFLYLGNLLPDFSNFLFVIPFSGLVLLPVGFKFQVPDKFELGLLTSCKGPLKVSLLFLLGPECCCWWQALVTPLALLPFSEV